MKRNPRVLRVLLAILAVDAALGGVILLFSSRVTVSNLFPYPPPSEVTDLFMMSRKEWGALGLGLSAIIAAAAVDPRRYAAVVYSIAGAVVIAAVGEVTVWYRLDGGRLYPAWSVWSHASARLLVGAALLYFRPRERWAAAERDTTLQEDPVPPNNEMQRTKPVQAPELRR